MTEKPISQQSFTEVNLASEVVAKSSKAQETKKEVGVNDSEIRLEITNNTWIQIIYRNDEKRTKNYVAGDSINLKRDELQGLVIGNAGSVKLIACNKQQDISRFVVSGSNVAKIFGEKLRAIGR